MAAITTTVVAHSSCTSSVVTGTVDSDFADCITSEHSSSGSVTSASLGSLAEPFAESASDPSSMAECYLPMSGTTVAITVVGSCRRMVGKADFTS